MKPAEPLLEAVDVAFSYGGPGPQILTEFSHSFLPETVTGLAGESGRGKSTLLYLLGLLLTPTAGSIRIGGLEASGISDAARSRIRARYIGFVFQDAALDPSRSVLDNVVEGSLFMGMRRREALIEAYHLLDKFGVELRADRRPGEISGGQAQRVALARALVGKPRVVLADEPTGNLDSVNAELVTAALRGAACSGAAVVIASHDQRVLDSCDSIVAPC